MLARLFDSRCGFRCSFLYSTRPPPPAHFLPLPVSQMLRMLRSCDTHSRLALTSGLVLVHLNSSIFKWLCTNSRNLTLLITSKTSDMCQEVWLGGLVRLKPGFLSCRSCCCGSPSRRGVGKSAWKCWSYDRIFGGSSEMHGDSSKISCSIAPPPNKNTTGEVQK